MTMLKLSKKADYALIAVRHLATHAAERSHSAADIAEIYGISAPLLAKVRPSRFQLTPKT